MLYRVEIFGYHNSLCANAKGKFYKAVKLVAQYTSSLGFTLNVRSCQISVKNKTSQTNMINAQGSYQKIQTRIIFQIFHIMTFYLQLIQPQISWVRPWKYYLRTKLKHK